MKQLVIKKGRPVVVEVGEPVGEPGHLLVATGCSCVSPGTEMVSMHASGRSLVRRALDQPAKARDAVLKLRHGGLKAIWAKAKSTMEREGLCGYSAAGVVLDAGAGVDGFQRGMKVAIAGAGHANHAEVALVPKNLAVPIPDGVDLAEASTVALGAIAMQGVRRAGVSVGERVAVIGCGPLGLLTVQMLRVSGCRVFAADLDLRRLERAGTFGAEVGGNPETEDVVAKATHWSAGQGVDAVLVTAATGSSEPLSQAFRMCRRKGRVVLVGVAGSEYRREDMYAKELDFLISTSYGPGRYDPEYEREGRDYPLSYVRWTERRNMEAYLDLIARGHVNVAPLIEIREPLERAQEAYAALDSPERPLLAVLDYSLPEEPPPSSGKPEVRSASWTRPAAGKVGLGLVGSGSFVQGVHVPNLLALADRFLVRWACSRTGTSARAAARLIDGCRATTSFADLLGDPEIAAVLIGTRHDSHAALAIDALAAGKAVFVEKPMCLGIDEFTALKEAVEASEAPFLVGYNRRFSPFARRLRESVAGRAGPMMLHYTMNAGFLPHDHWTQGREGGGRLIGEACHIVDLFRFLVGHPVTGVSCDPVRGNGGVLPTDNFVLTLSYADGSVASLIYTARGHRGWPKEHLRVFFDEKVFALHDYRTMEAIGVSGGGLELKIPDKGHREELQAFGEAVCAGERFVIPWEELVETWTVCHAADELCRRGAPIDEP